MKRKTMSLFLAMLCVLTFTACGHTHQFGEWVVSKDATCTSDGIKERKCSDCGETETETIPSGSHAFGEWEETKPVTCTEDGEQVKTCSICGATEKETIKASGHSFAPATLFAPKTCKVCGQTEGEARGNIIEIGQEIETSDCKFTITDVSFATTVSESSGNVTYSTSEGFYLVIKVEFTNLASDPVSSWNSERFSDITMEYAGKFNYEGRAEILSDDIIPLDTKNVYFMYTVPKELEADDGKPIHAAFGIDGEIYAVIVREGTAGEDSTQEAPKQQELDENLSVGDHRTDGSNFEFTLDRVYFATKVSETHGYTTYNSEEGYFLVLQLSFTNLAPEAVDMWDSARVEGMNAQLDNKYNYEGNFTILEDAIVPLKTKNAYIMYAVPETLSDGEEPLSATFTIDGQKFVVDCRENIG